MESCSTRRACSKTPCSQLRETGASVARSTASGRRARLEERGGHMHANARSAYKSARPSARPTKVRRALCRNTCTVVSPTSTHSAPDPFSSARRSSVSALGFAPQPLGAPARLTLCKVQSNGAWSRPWALPFSRSALRRPRFSAGAPPEHQRSHSCAAPPIPTTLWYLRARGEKANLGIAQKQNSR